MTERQEVFVLGVPRSGTTWLCRLLGDALNSEIASGLEWPSNADEGADRPGPYIIRLRHPYQVTIQELLKAPTVKIVRDPRDVVVSIREYWGMDNWADAINMASDEFAALDRLGDLPVFTRFRWLLDDTVGELGRILGLLQFKYEDQELKEVAARQSWELRKATLSDAHPFSAAHQLRAIGHGRAERWKEEIPDEVLRQVHDELWPWISGYGYETDPAWWEHEMGRWRSP